MEIKYSTKNNNNQSTPKWNSNIPKPNSLYLFANPTNFTFFLGGDYISPEIRLMFIDHFNNFNEKEKITNLNREIQELKISKPGIKNPFGLFPKIRIDYLEKVEYQLGEDLFQKYKTIFEFSKNNNWEQRAIKYLKGLESEE